MHDPTHQTASGDDRTPVLPDDVDPQPWWPAIEPAVVALIDAWLADPSVAALFPPDRMLPTGPHEVHRLMEYVELALDWEMEQRGLVEPLEPLPDTIIIVRGPLV